MTTTRNDFETEDEAPIIPLTAEQARQLRAEYPPVSPWWVVVGQVLTGAVVALAAAALSGKQNVGWSLAYGALSVAVPAGVFVRAITRGGASRPVGAAWLGWELVKISLTLALLAAAPRVVPGLHWLALLAGVILATKMYWVALAFTRRPRRRN